MRHPRAASAICPLKRALPCCALVMREVGLPKVGSECQAALKLASIRTGAQVRCQVV